MQNISMNYSSTSYMSSGNFALKSNRTPVALALVLTIGHMFPGPTAASTSPGDWANGVSTFSIPGEETRGGPDSYTTAYLHVTYYDYDKNTNVSDKEEVAKYGEGYIGPASGILVHVTGDDVDDHTACTFPIRGTRGRDLPTQSWIALIKRGECNFELKVQHAFRSNASGVVIYNDKDATTLDKMKLSADKERNISAVFTYKWKGEELARLTDNGLGIVKLYIEIGSHCNRPYNNINRTSVLFVSISFIVLMIISLAWLVFYYVQRFRYIHAKDRLSRRLCSAAKKALSKIPTKAIKTDDKEIQGDGECCAICIEPYKVTDICRILPCKHEFHKNCIDPWLLEHRTCPMCKMDILKHYGFVFTGSQESILHLDLDGEGEEVLESEPGSPRHDGVSPLPQIRGDIECNEELSDDEIYSNPNSRPSSPTEITPSLQAAGPSNHNDPEFNGESNQSQRLDVFVSCAGCISVKNLPEERIEIYRDEKNNNNSDDDEYEDQASCRILPHGCAVTIVCEKSSGSENLPKSV